MKKKHYYLSIVIVILTIIGVAFLIFHYKSTKEEAYIGYVNVYFYNNVTNERIINITSEENLIIMDSYTQELPMGNGEYSIFKKYQFEAESWEEGELIRESLLKYKEVYNIELYSKG